MPYRTTFHTEQRGWADIRQPSPLFCRSHAYAQSGDKQKAPDIGTLFPYLAPHNAVRPADSLPDSIPQGIMTGQAHGCTAVGMEDLPSLSGGKVFQHLVPALRFHLSCPIIIGFRHDFNSDLHSRQPQSRTNGPFPRTNGGNFSSAFAN